MNFVDVSVNVLCSNDLANYGFDCSSTLSKYSMTRHWFKSAVEVCGIIALEDINPCDLSTLSLTTDPTDVVLVAGSTSYVRVLGQKSNTEAVAQGDNNFCGAYSEATVTTSSPATVDIPSANSWTMTVSMADATVFGVWSATLSFHLVDYPNVIYSRNFQISVYSVEP